MFHVKRCRFFEGLRGCKSALKDLGTERKLVLQRKFHVKQGFLVTKARQLLSHLTPFPASVQLLPPSARTTKFHVKQTRHNQKKWQLLPHSCTARASSTAICCASVE